MPSTSRAISAMISMALPEVKEDMVIFDLGSGWGGLAVALAKHFPNHRVYGIENSLFPFLYSRLRNLLFPRSNLYYLRGDILEIKFDSPCIIVCYLYSGAMKKLKEKFEQDLQEGSVILSNTFTLVDKVPEDILELNDLYKTKIYKYRFKRQSTIQTHDCNLM